MSEKAKTPKESKNETSVDASVDKGTRIVDNGMIYDAVIELTKAVAQNTAELKKMQAESQRWFSAGRFR